MPPPSDLRLLLVAGARPNFVKVAALVWALAASSASDAASPPVKRLLVHTGQHYDDALSRLFFEQLDLPRPDINLEVGSGSHGVQTGLVMERFEPVVMDWKPDAVIVVGDVNSTLAAALVAAKLHVPVAHIEAGLRSFDRTMPEEINRVLTDDLAAWLFASEPSAVVNLRLEGHPDKSIHLVGNVMIDSLQRFLPAAKNSGALKAYDLLRASASSESPVARPFALVTLHRPSNVDEAGRLAAFVGALAELGRRVPVLFPAHPRTAERLRAFGLSAGFRDAWDREGRGVRLVPPLGYLEFLDMMSAAACVLTDSGGIQEETTALGIPCLTLRETTERPITVEEGTNIIVGLDPLRILAAADDALSGRGRRGGPESRSFGTGPPLWDGHAGERIISILWNGLRSRCDSAQVSRDTGS